METIITTEKNYKDKWNQLKAFICDKMIEAITNDEHETSRLLSIILHHMAENDNCEYDWLIPACEKVQNYASIK